VRGVLLDNLVREAAADDTLGVEHRVGGVAGGLDLGGLTDEALALVEGDPRRRGAVTLAVGNDLDLAVLPDTHARVRRAQVDTDNLREALLGALGALLALLAGLVDLLLDLHALHLARGLVHLDARDLLLLHLERGLGLREARLERLVALLDRESLRVGRDGLGVFLM